MNKQTAAALGKEIQAVLEMVALNHGLTVKVRGGTFDSEVGTFKPRIEFVEGDAARNQFNLFARMVGLTEDDFDAQFTSHGKTFRVAGVNPKAPKFPVMATCVEDGKTYKFPEFTVLLGLGRREDAMRRKELKAAYS